MSRPEANGNGLNEFIRAVLSLDQISFVMTHQAEQDRQTIMNKYRFKVPELTELTPWKERATDLNWEYCECGCKCFHVMVGQLQFSLQSSTVSSHYLRIGHGGHGRYLGIFPNMEAASARVLVEVRGEIDRMKQTLRMLGEL